MDWAQPTLAVAVQIAILVLFDRMGRDAFGRRLEIVGDRLGLAIGPPAAAYPDDADPGQHGSGDDDRHDLDRRRQHVPAVAIAGATAGQPVEQRLELDRPSHLDGHQYHRRQIDHAPQRQQNDPNEVLASHRSASRNASTSARSTEWSR